MLTDHFMLVSDTNTTLLPLRWMFQRLIAVKVVNWATNNVQMQAVTVTRLEKGGWRLSCLMSKDIFFFFLYIYECEYKFHMNYGKLIIVSPSMVVCNMKWLPFKTSRWLNFCILEYLAANPEAQGMSLLCQCRYHYMHAVSHMPLKQNTQGLQEV